MNMIIILNKTQRIIDSVFWNEPNIIMNNTIIIITEKQKLHRDRNDRNNRYYYEKRFKTRFSGYISKYTLP